MRQLYEFLIITFITIIIIIKIPQEHLSMVYIWYWEEEHFIKLN